jgi:hypothetical protein
VVDRLGWFTARAFSGVYLQKTASGWRAELEPLVDFYDQTLTHGKLRVNVGPALARVLRFGELSGDEPVWAYHPPASDPFTIAGKVGWVDVTERGFELLAK